MCGSFHRPNDSPGSCPRDPFDYPPRGVQKVPGLAQAHRLYLDLAPPEVCGDYPGLIRTLTATRRVGERGVAVVRQHLRGEEGQAGCVSWFKAFVSYEAALG